jgi:outer membrane protein TolC
MRRVSINRALSSGCAGIVFVVGVWLSGSAIAQDESGVMSVKDVLAAIEANGDFALTMAAADIAIAQARLDEATSGLMPRLSLSATSQLYRPSPTHTYPDDNAEAFGNLEVVQPLFDFGKTGAEMDAAGIEVAAAKDAESTVRNTMLLEGLALYFNLHASELQLRVLEESNTSAYLTWNRAKENLSLGRASPLDVAQALNVAERTRLDFYRERTRNAAYRLRLQELMGTALPEELITPPEPPVDRPVEVDRDGFAEQVISRNLELQILDKQVEALAMRRDGLGALPSLDAFGAVGATSREIRGRNDYAVGARLSWPIFDGGVTDARKMRMAAQTSRLLAQREAKKSELRMQAYQYLMERGDAYQQVIAALAAFDYSDKNLLMRQQLYDQERVADLGSAMVEHTASEAELVRATGAYYLVMARIAAVLGEHPGRGLEPDFLTQTIGLQVAPEGEFIPKAGTGFGQDDQDEVIKKPAEKL